METFKFSNVLRNVEFYDRIIVQNKMKVRDCNDFNCENWKFVMGKKLILHTLFIRKSFLRYFEDYEE